MVLPEWGALLGECLETLARRCDEAGPHIVGHIKGLALLPDGGYVRVSVVSPRHPADVEVGGSIQGGRAELDFALNVLVYGLPRDLARRLTEEVAGSLAARGEGQVSLDVALAQEQDYHQHE